MSGSPSAPPKEWKVQLSKKIGGDLWNFRAEDAEDFEALVRDLAEVIDDSMTSLADVVQAVLARGVQTDGYSSSNERSSVGGNNNRQARSNDGPPRCKHGEMKDFGSRGYKHRYYCPSKDRSDQCPAQD